MDCEDGIKNVRFIDAILGIVMNMRITSSNVNVLATESETVDDAAAEISRPKRQKCAPEKM